jgi:transcriptional regulator with XRE-family HTH domain
MSFRKWLRDMRVQKDESKYKSARDIAREIGCTPSEYSAVESGYNSNPQLLEKIANYWGFDVKMFEEKDKENYEPMSDSLKKFINFLKAEDEAFEKAGIKTGRVSFTCPICSGVAVANRYWHGGRIHGLGSGCKKCGISHT